MRFNTIIYVTVEKYVGAQKDLPADAKPEQVVVIERPVSKHGTICFDGHWVAPDERLANPRGTPCPHCGKDLVTQYQHEGDGDKYRCGGCWRDVVGGPEYFIRIYMPAPHTVRQKRINIRCAAQLAAMSIIGLGGR